MTNNVIYASCIKCGCQVEARADLTTCPKCGGLLDIVYDYERAAHTLTRENLASRPQGMWRYRELLPVNEQKSFPGLSVGGTPLYRTDRLARAVGVKEMYVKDEGLNPTASMKDRASAMAVVKASEGGYKQIACASTGNAASSLAGNAAAAGLETFIFVPERAPKGKIAQLLIFGAHVFSIQGDYQDAFRMAAAAIDRWGWYNRNAAINPYMLEGKKTVAMEIAEQLNWQAPDWVCVSVGDGCTIAGVAKGFWDLYRVGLLSRIPRLLSVQAAGCYPINEAFRNKEPLKIHEENTLADSIAVGVPRNPDKALRAISDTNGATIEVSDEEILNAMRLLGKTSGIFGEPAGVAALAGLVKAVQNSIIDPDSSVVHIVTGNGLKDTANGIKAAGEPYSLPPRMDLLAKIVANL